MLANPALRHVRLTDRLHEWRRQAESRLVVWASGTVALVAISSLGLLISGAGVRDLPGFASTLTPVAAAYAALVALLPHGRALLRWCIMGALATGALVPFLPASPQRPSQVEVAAEWLVGNPFVALPIGLAALWLLPGSLMSIRLSRIRFSRLRPGPVGIARRVLSGLLIMAVLAGVLAAGGSVRDTLGGPGLAGDVLLAWLVPLTVLVCAAWSRRASRWFYHVALLTTAGLGLLMGAPPMLAGPGLWPLIMIVLPCAIVTSTMVSSLLRWPRI
ncbi:hypothetical protein [Nonomuraea gerenzanensis]|uniref:hypothetical protein n=1 Tax=Nonomuraea gerenzanensis TaxID=93944 RepID=UPI001CD94524|nr:hypothetical protein [Nonomuraea gerenzanensis]UBU09275.1 hypothetical protein LCN96_33485 [Nonomuraea gerenzanensis]